MLKNNKIFFFFNFKYISLFIIVKKTFTNSFLKACKDSGFVPNINNWTILINSKYVTQRFGFDFTFY